jgi:hypothetical protein
MFGGIKMKEELRREIEERIKASFEEALGPKPPARKLISEEERQARTARYADVLIKSALRKVWKC